MDSVTVCHTWLEQPITVRHSELFEHAELKKWLQEKKQHETGLM